MRASNQDCPVPAGVTVKSYTRARGIQSQDIHNRYVRQTQQCDGCFIRAEERTRKFMDEMTHGILAQQAGTP
jgi:hypothetical protein